MATFVSFLTRTQSCIPYRSSWSLGTDRNDPCVRGESSGVLVAPPVAVHQSVEELAVSELLGGPKLDEVPGYVAKKNGVEIDCGIEE